MKRMWSPWRSAYIQTFKTPPKAIAGRESIFASAWKDKRDDKNLIVWRGRHCFVIMNRYPYNSGHVMIVPYRQTSTIHDLTEEELLDLMTTARMMMKALDTVMKPQGYNLGANFGRASGAGVDDHIHLHIVPRWNGDTNFMPVLGDIKVISEDMKATLKKLRAALRKSAQATPRGGAKRTHKR